MKTLTSLAVAIASCAIFTAIVFVYLWWEGPNKARIEGIMIPLPPQVVWRFRIHDWIGHYWYMPAFAIFVTAYVVTRMAPRHPSEKGS